MAQSLVAALYKFVPLPDFEALLEDGAVRKDQDGHGALRGCGQQFRRLVPQHDLPEFHRLTRDEEGVAGPHRIRATTEGVQDR